MIEDIPLDRFDDNEAYDENNDLINTGFSADDENAYDSVTPGSRIDRQRQDLIKGRIRELERKFNTSIPVTEYDRFRLSGKELQFKNLTVNTSAYPTLARESSWKALAFAVVWAHPWLATCSTSKHQLEIKRKLQRFSIQYPLN